MILIAIPLFCIQEALIPQERRPRLRELGVEVGIFRPGTHNAISDVDGVRVGHVTLIEGDRVRTGVTAILPHGDNLFQNKVPAAFHVGNGFGKFIGSTQIAELGQIETPILLTNTLSVWDVANGTVDYMLSLPGNENVRSINPVVGEVNDGALNDIRGRHVKREHAVEAIRTATTGTVEEGSVGAGTGTVCFGWKGGIGTSSRVLPQTMGGYVVGVLVQTNYGGVLELAGVPLGKELGQYQYKDQLQDGEDGSCVILVATDAPLAAPQLKRLAKRALLALGRTGSAMSHGSGDYVVAFSTATELRIKPSAPRVELLPRFMEDNLSPLFRAVVEATEEAIYNSLLKASTMRGIGGREIPALPIDRLVSILRAYGRIP
jgi:D-aminopeptidase